MAIILKNAPDKSFNEFKNNVHSFHKGEIKLDAKGNHHHYTPHIVYNANANDLAADKALANVVQTGWRFIFQDANGTYHVAEVGMKAEMEDHSFRHVNVGAHVNSFVDIFNGLENHEHVKLKDYKISILRVPSLYIMVIWFQGTDHDHEFFIPLAPVHSKFEAGKTYQYTEFIKLLQEAAPNMVSIPSVPVPHLPQDDLKMIEGIGPKLAEILKNAGYPSFQSLARASSDDLKTILVAAGYPYITYDPSTWPNQASLAAEGRWEALKQLQDELKGGRR